MSAALERLNDIMAAMVKKFDPKDSEDVPVYSIVVVQDFFEEYVSYLLVNYTDYDTLVEYIKSTIRKMDGIDQEKLVDVAVELAEMGKASADARKDFKTALSEVEYGSELSELLHFGFYPADITNLAKLHKEDVFREKIEDLLEDCNFHKEQEDFIEGRYDEYLSSGLEKAKMLITDFCTEEYDQEPTEKDFTDLHNVGLAYTELGDDNQWPVQVTADLVDFKVTYEFDNKVYAVDQYKDIEDMIDNCLSNLNFDDLISGAYDYADDALERAKLLISDRRKRIGGEADFSDLHRVFFVFDAVDGWPEPVRLFVDLEDYKIIGEINGYTYNLAEYEDVDELTLALDGIDTDELIKEANEQYSEDDRYYN